MLPDLLSSLAHPKRLDVFRLLMRRYPDAVPAGEIARALDLKANTASVYFAALKQAGLIQQTRTGTSLQYTVHLPTVRDLFGGLLAECCQNRPDLCLPTLDASGLPETETSQTGRTFNVLFVCTANSARSIIAETLLRAEGKGKFNVYSAGTHPAACPHPDVVEMLKAKGFGISELRSKPTEEFRGDDAPVMDFVFTVCDQSANEHCEVWHGQPMNAHWGLADPIKATGTEAERKLAFQQTYGLLRNRIGAFANLPLHTLDRISLQHALDDIAQTSRTSQ